MKNIFVLLVLPLTFAITSKAFAQSEYPIFKDSSTLREEDNEKLFLEIDNLNYLKNYEYFGKIPLGYTLFGYQLIPQLIYQPNEHFIFKGGIFLRHEFGRAHYASIAPVFTAKYQNNGFSFLIGNLEGALNHRYVEPIKDIESIISHRMEQGAQLLLDKKRIWLDVYIDWEKAIDTSSAFKEEFTAGGSSRIKLINSETWLIELPIQFMFAHKGGQIDIAPPGTPRQPDETLFNFASGLSLTRMFKSSFWRGIRAENYFVYYKNLSPGSRIFNEGMGFYSSLTFKTKFFDFDLRYWNGNKFIGPRGGSLYTSVSQKIPGYVEKKRELFFVSLIYDKQIYKNIFLDLRFEPYYDIKNSLLEYAYAIHLRFKKDFYLTRLNNKNDK